MKKIRVTVPEDIWRMMRNDVEEFGINNNKLCNYILDKLKYKKDINVEKLLETQGRPLKKIIQFDLNVANREIYYDVLKENHVDIEAEFFRELFEVYTSKFKYQRELFIYEERLKSILEAIKLKRKLKLKYINKIYTVEPFFVKREEQGDENFLFCFCEEAKGYRNYKLKELEIISILDDKIKGKDKKYIESVRKNFDPFLGNGNFVKVRLTGEGVSLMKSLTNYRPKFLKRSGDVYTFEASNENAKLYFRQFLKEAVILEPKELREEMKNEFLEAFESYNS
ncbi:WYL domain-containing protein [Ilyobacter polytropus]|uniref:DeoR family transcriptional regulator n=1 Tax=Ilyobacter polytropus (strain ATCC 51220 / DSM 2926 / LMG 16218 / CuHBu1) TaxID=572544 RepID=E3HCM0_ILYPC|nr:WYL domain-containing protein [Ilyobacter polytropus]ADO83996.1 DeoR family transcriptional regulator [Ilyobacter polytropus DSM 2926]